MVAVIPIAVSGNSLIQREAGLCRCINTGVNTSIYIKFYFMHKLKGIIPRGIYVVPQMGEYNDYFSLPDDSADEKFLQCDRLASGLSGSRLLFIRGYHVQGWVPRSLQAYISVGFLCGNSMYTVQLKTIRTKTGGDRSCHQVEWSENILCGGRRLFTWRTPHKIFVLHPLH